MGTITNLQIALNTRKKKSLLKSSYPKNTWQNFPTQENPEIENFKPKKNPSIIPATWNPEYPRPHPTPGFEGVYNIIIDPQ